MTISQCRYIAVVVGYAEWFFFCISVFFYIESNSYLVVYSSEIKYFCDIETK